MINPRLKKISAAMYRVTDLMIDEEPLKWRLRERAIDIMRHDAQLGADRAFQEKVRESTAVAGAVKEMLDLLDIASSVSFISQVNYEVLGREYRGYLRNLRIDEEEVTLKLPATSGGAHNIGHTAALRSNVANVGEEKVGRDTRDTTIEDTSKRVPRAHTLRAAHTTTRSPAPASHHERAARIVDFLRTHAWASRGDILRIFQHEISEKTLQRELAALADAGVIERKGEKRWCRYAVK